MQKIIVLILLLVSPFSFADTQNPESEKDDAKFVRLTHQLEQDPLGDADKSTRGWLLQWATESKDVYVLVCGTLGPIPEQNSTHSGILLLQMLFGNASFQILHPDRKNDLTATQLAGVRSAMQAYSSIISKHPNAHIAYFDELLSKDKTGDLEQFLTPIIAEECGKNDKA